MFLPGEAQGRGSLVGCSLPTQSRTRLKRLSSSSSSSRTFVVVISSVKNAYLQGSTLFCHFLQVSIQTSLYGEVFTGHTLFKTTTPLSLHNICPFLVMLFLSSYHLYKYLTYYIFTYLSCLFVSPTRIPISFGQRILYGLFTTVNRM